MVLTHIAWAAMSYLFSRVFSGPIHEGVHCSSTLLVFIVLEVAGEHILLYAMKQVVTLLFIVFSIAIPVVGQSEIDTIYYDRDWKGVENKAFATFYRIVYIPSDSNYQKMFRDYYITGELQTESGFITIDRYDDANSIFDGEWVSYYKSGNIAEKANRVNGILEGEYIAYNEDGLVTVHSNYRGGKLNGVFTEFLENGDYCIQVEYRNGEPIFDYYVLSDKEGFCSKVSLEDDQPIYDSPTLNERQIQYIDGEELPYYNKNGIIVGMLNEEVRDYGKYYQITVVIANNSMFPIEFEPEKVTASLVKKKGKTYALNVLSADEYMEKVRRKQEWAMALNGLAEGLAAAGAGYTSSTTNSSYSGYSSSYGNASAYGSGGYAYGNYSGSSSYYGYSSSTTTSYNAAAAYQAQVIASNRVAEYNDALLSERDAKDEGYLRRTTIYPGETIYGYINIERKKGVSMTVDIDINGAVYTFPWNINY